MEVSEFLSKFNPHPDSQKLLQECISLAYHKLCKLKKSSNEVITGKLMDGSSLKEFLILKKNQILSFKPEEILSVNLKFKKNDFCTDNEISKSKNNRRNLELWNHDGPELALESEDRNWNQFETNAEKFGVVSTYEEELYTTKKVNPCMLSKEQLKAAHEKEKQILSKACKEVEEEEEDEEKLFSAVIGSGRYQEPEPMPKRERAISMASSVEFFSKDEYKKTREYLMNPQRSKKMPTPDIGSLDALDLTVARPNNEEVIMSFYKFKQEMQPSRQTILKSFQEFSQKFEGKTKGITDRLMIIQEEEFSIMNLFVTNWKQYAGRAASIKIN